MKRVQVGTMPVGEFLEEIDPGYHRRLLSKLAHVAWVGFMAREYHVDIRARVRSAVRLKLRRAIKQARRARTALRNQQFDLFQNLYRLARDDVHDAQKAAILIDREYERTLVQEGVDRRAKTSQRGADGQIKATWGSAAAREEAKAQIKAALDRKEAVDYTDLAKLFHVNERTIRRLEKEVKKED